MLSRRQNLMGQMTPVIRQKRPGIQSQNGKLRKKQAHAGALAVLDEHKDVVACVRKTC